MMVVHLEPLNEVAADVDVDVEEQDAEGDEVRATDLIALIITIYSIQVVKALQRSC